MLTLHDGLSLFTNNHLLITNVLPPFSINWNDYGTWTDSSYWIEA